jgi:hypothetical protein
VVGSKSFDISGTNSYSVDVDDDLGDASTADFEMYHLEVGSMF